MAEFGQSGTAVAPIGAIAGSISAIMPQLAHGNQTGWVSARNALEGLGMTFSVDLYWSFRSPFCYLALDRLLGIHREYETEINVRPVYPIAVRDPDFFKVINRHYRPYHTRDSHRVAAYLGVPFRRPVPDPIVQDMETNAIAAEQPYIFDLTRLGMAAASAGGGLAFIDKVSRILWDGTVDGWNEGDHLSEAVARAGLDYDALATRVKAEPERLDALLETNQRDHDAAGHWGVPTMVFEDEPFYGQDRVEMLLWRMRERGLSKRN